MQKNSAQMTSEWVLQYLTDFCHFCHFNDKSQTDKHDILMKKEKQVRNCQC